MNCIPSTSYNPSHSTLAGSNQAVQHPITALFNEIPWSHQCSILNCLLFTQVVMRVTMKKKLAYMNSLVNVINASANDAADYFQLYGKERMEHDIANLTK